MASLREIRRRIKSVKSINDITKAMELISAVRFKKVDKRFHQANNYFANLERLVSRVLSSELTQKNPFFEKRTVRTELLIVISGDRGLCGSFNSNILKLLQKYILEHSDRKIVVFPIGKVVNNFVRKRNYNVIDHWIDIGYQFKGDDLKTRTQKFVDGFLNQEYDKVTVISGRFSRTGSTGAVIENYLDLGYLLDLNKDENKQQDYIFEPDKQSVLDTLVQLYIKQKFFMLLLRSVTAEYFARMLAMKQASDNGKELVQELTLERNKVRQAMITRELSEIIGGANALN